MKTARRTPVFRGRSDTIFGVCEAIGQEFGFNATWLRVALGVGVVFSVPKVAAVYAVLGLIVLATRLAFPVQAVAAAPVVVAAQSTKVVADNDAGLEPMVLAA